MEIVVFHKKQLSNGCESAEAMVSAVYRGAKLERFPKGVQGRNLHGKSYNGLVVSSSGEILDYVVVAS